MRKKSLDESIGVEQFNQKLFAQSMEMITKCKKIPLNLLNQHYRDGKVREKYHAIESKINSIFKILGRFSQAEKPPLGDSLDFGVEIFEENKVLIETQLKKLADERNTVKRITNLSQHKRKRPQQIYPNIGVYQNYSPHYHKELLENGTIPPFKTCQTITEPTDMNNECLYVDTLPKLNRCLKELKEVDEIAVDVEHSNKSYEGFTCLIQLSSRVRDYIIDVFPIWEHVGRLSEVISDPNILKVMHGADMDTKWLQRDFNIHIVNLFDTHKASRVLGMAKFSYAFLLQNYCQVNTNKMYQRADWRERPLIPEMILYARMDTHYLLTIYDHMRMDLQKQAEQMNLSIASIFSDIHKSSHEVSLIENEPFSYKNKQLYQNLEYEFSKSKEKSNFLAIQTFLWALNKISFEKDENFDEIAPKKILVESIGLIKDLIYNKKAKVSKKIRIDKILAILKKNQNEHMAEAISLVKQELQKYFTENQMEEEYPEIRPTMKKNKVEVEKKSRLESLSDEVESMRIECNEKFKREEKQNSINFAQFGTPFFNNSLQRSKKPIFKPVLSFLTEIYGVAEKKIEESQEESQMASEQIQDADLKVEEGIEKEKEKDEGVIEFKRMNPNVVYTIEAPEDQEIQDALNNRHPRKRKRELEYESRLKNKTGNIYDLLED